MVQTKQNFKKRLQELCAPPFNPHYGSVYNTVRNNAWMFGALN